MECSGKSGRCKALQDWYEAATGSGSLPRITWNAQIYNRPLMAYLVLHIFHYRLEFSCNSCFALDSFALKSELLCWVLALMSSPSYTLSVRVLNGTSLKQPKHGILALGRPLQP